MTLAYCVSARTQLITGVESGWWSGSQEQWFCDRALNNFDQLANFNNAHATTTTVVIHWLNQINRLFETQTSFVLATIWSINGTSPDSTGARLVVTDVNCYGQFQSAHRQEEVVRQSRKMLASNTSWWKEKDYPLGDIASTHNGHATVVFEKFDAITTTPEWLRALHKSIREGQSTVLANQINRQNGTVQSSYKVMPDAIEHFKKANELTSIVGNNNSKTLLHLIKEPHPTIAVVGDSQVTESLVQQLLLLPFQVQWLTEHNNSTGQTNKLQRILLNDQAIEILSAGTRVAIATKDHELDIHYCHRALLNSNLPYVGCLGSQRKANLVKARLTKLGVSASRLSALVMPIGIQSITGKQPSIIAASIVAQLLSNS